MVLFRPARIFARSFSSGKHFLDSWPLKSRSGEVNLDELKKKVIMLYFSAGWCVTCKNFTPKLKEFYDKTKDDGFEVVWVSRDKSAEDQLEYYNKSLPPWPYFLYGSPAVREVLKRYKIQGLPFAITLNSNGDVIDDAAKKTIETCIGPPQQDPKALLQKWKKAQ
uniref:protein-disulfide reductase n=1 Tax=Acrobeloides nanus TaxID=290746 RepID=A0A914C311_9BILA